MLEDRAAASLLWMVVSVVLIIGLAYWVTRYVAGRGGLGGIGPLKSGTGLEILSQLILGRDQKLAVVRAGERYFLLGITAAGVSMLAEFTAEEAAAWREQTAEERAQTPGFREALHTVLRQKGRR